MTVPILMWHSKMTFLEVVLSFRWKLDITFHDLLQRGPTARLMRADAA
ncbi:MAG: hypothetical protein AAEJ43_13665 [Gammaproteobacteria bacterium]